VSTNNIIAITPSAGTLGGENDAVLVTFRMKNGGTRTYRYEGMDALAVLNGSDPADLNGERVS
jgi:hypothetical protein